MDLGIEVLLRYLSRKSLEFGVFFRSLGIVGVDVLLPILVGLE